MSDEDPLEEIMEDFEETKEASSKYAEYQKQVKKQKRELVEKVQDLEDEEEISTTKADEILRLVQNAQYGKAREHLKEAYEKQGLEFDAEEKNIFAQKFTEEYEKLQEETERIRNSLLELKNGADREQIIDYLHGKYSKFTKTELRAVFDALDKIGSSGFSTKDQARVLAAFESDLTMTTTKEILEEIENEADTDE